jgi:predicted HAD superfamily Cof-like phosphohydrolase
MHLTQLALLEFHKKMNQTIGDPRSPDITADQAFRLKLINEELKELQEALDAGDTIKAADGLADLIYVLAGCGVAWGIDLASVFEEVHRSNMTKEPGNESSGGKAIKGPAFSPADIAGVLKDAAENLDTGPDGWWEEPTVGKAETVLLCNACGRRKSKSAGCYDGSCSKGPRHEINTYDPKDLPSFEQIHQNLMAQAKDQAKILAMKSIKADFITVPQTDENYPLADPTAWEMPCGDGP